MEFTDNSNELSYFVANEMNDMLFDDSFARKSQEVYITLMKTCSKRELKDYDIFCQTALAETACESSESDTEKNQSIYQPQVTENHAEESLAAVYLQPWEDSDNSKSSVVDEIICQKTLESSTLNEESTSLQEILIPCETDSSDTKYCKF